MVFNEQNVHGQCISCNMFKEGNRQGYLKGLMRRYGPDYVMNIEVKKNLPQPPWQTWQYEAMIRHYTKKVKEMSNGK